MLQKFTGKYAFLIPDAICSFRPRIVVLAFAQLISIVLMSTWEVTAEPDSWTLLNSSAAWSARSRAAAAVLNGHAFLAGGCQAWNSRVAPSW